MPKKSTRSSGFYAAALKSKISGPHRMLFKVPGKIRFERAFFRRGAVISSFNPPTTVIAG